MVARGWFGHDVRVYVRVGVGSSQYAPGLSQSQQHSIEQILPERHSGQSLPAPGGRLSLVTSNSRPQSRHFHIHGGFIPISFPFLS